MEGESSAAATTTGSFKANEQIKKEGDEAQAEKESERGRLEKTAARETRE
jgi:hypothetical protein